MLRMKLPGFFVLAASTAALAGPPSFAVRPLADENAFAGSIYKAVLLAEGCPQPSIVVDQPARAVFEDDTLKYLPPGDAGTSFTVRVRAVSAGGEAVASWRVTLVSAVALDFAAASEYAANFTPQLARVPAPFTRTLDLAGVQRGDLQIPVPSTGGSPGEDLDSWCGFDRRRRR